jgi:hypothetical protein
MTEQHSISPSLELIIKWEMEWNEIPEGKVRWINSYIAARAAQWGADKELKACCEWLITGPYGASIACHAEQMISDLRAARRPKPPSAIEQAESLIERHEDGWVPNPAQWHVIREGLAEGRRALEALPNNPTPPPSNP